MTAPLRQGEAIAPHRFGPFDEAAVAAYAAASGDDNPLHRDPAIAAAAGLDRPPIHGMLIVGCFEPYLSAWRPEARLLGVAAKFIRPVLVGEAIEISGKVVQAAPGAPAMVRLTVKRHAEGAAAELVCLGEARIA